MTGGTPEGLSKAASSIVGAANVHAATADDAVEDVSPQIVVEPPDPESAGGVLAWASRDRVPLIIRGAGTKLTWGAPLRSASVVLSTARLHAVIEHRHGDLTATVQAGAALSAVNRELQAHRQAIALDPSHAETATIGGILATNDSGPRRHRYGSLRDQIIGITIARADGRLAKSGGIVVKNVAGYDLARLMTGSFGTLALTIDATFKLAPLAPASRTVVLMPGNLDHMGGLLAELAAGPLTPSAVELEMPPGRLLVRFETSDRAVEQQASEVATMAARRGARWDMAVDEAEEAIWTAHAARPWNGPGCVLKVSLLPAQLMSFAEWLRNTLGQASWELVGRAALGVMLLRVDGPPAEQEQLVALTRARVEAGAGHVSALRADPRLKARLGPPEQGSDALRLMQTIKRRFDPAGVLNPGRGPGGI
jgi:glycolate oxidase FAD binding subunit